MRLNEIIERFRLISGFKMKEVSQWTPVIVDCRAFFESRIADRDALADEDIRRLEHACAVYAYYRISQIAQMSDLGSFKVGDVQLNLRAVNEAAEKLWSGERENISDLGDFSDGFSFKRVRV